MSQLAAPQYAGFWRRVAATLIDTVIYTALFWLLLGSTVMEAGLFTLEGSLRTLLALLLTVVLWMKFLGTPGKLLLSCQVVDANTLAPLTLKQSILRYIGYFASILPLCLGLLWVAKDPRKQGFHDKIANTVVVYNAGLEADDESAKSLSQLEREAQ